MSNAVSGYGPAEKRAKNDFYETPYAATRCLLKREKFDTPIWEPACGNGAISRILIEAGYSTTSSDLVVREFPCQQLDFIADSQNSSYPFYRDPGEAYPPLSIVTNPPFKLAEQFIRKAADIGSQKTVMFLRLQFLEARGTLFRDLPPARVWVSTSRIDTRKGPLRYHGGLICFAWFVWERGFTGKTELGWFNAAKEEPRG